MARLTITAATLADMTELEARQCRGMWFTNTKGIDVILREVNMDTGTAQVVHPRHPGNIVAPTSDLTPRFDLHRAWNDDGSALPDRRPTADGVCASGGCTRKVSPSCPPYCVPHGRAHGLLEQRVPSGKAARRVRELHEDHGLSLSYIARAASVSTGTVRTLYVSPRPVIARKVFDKIMAVDPEQRPDSEMIPAWPYQRRVQALAAAGQAFDAIAEAAGINPGTVSQIASGKSESITRKVARKIAQCYDAQAALPVTTPSPAILRKGWPLPMVWEDIDDPSEYHPSHPVADGYVVLTETMKQRLAYLYEELGRDELLTQLGVSLSTLRRLTQGRARSVSSEVYDTILALYHQTASEQGKE